jgi:hypothetical protein
MTTIHCSVNKHRKAWKRSVAFSIVKQFHGHYPTNTLVLILSVVSYEYARLAEVVIM